MGDLRITQQAIEAAVSANADLRVTQVAVEVLATDNANTANLEITQQTIDVLMTPDSDVRVSQVVIETLVDANPVRPQYGWQNAGLLLGNTTTAWMNPHTINAVGYVQADILFVNTAMESLNTSFVPAGEQFPLFTLTGNDTGLGVALSSVGMSPAGNVQYVFYTINNGVYANTNSTSFTLGTIIDQRQTLRLEYKLSSNLTNGATDGWMKLYVNGVETAAQTNLYISMGSNTGDVYQLAIGNPGLAGVYDNLKIGYSG